MKLKQYFIKMQGLKLFDCKIKIFQNVLSQHLVYEVVYLPGTADGLRWVRTKAAQQTLGSLLPTAMGCSEGKSENVIPLPAPYHLPALCPSENPTVLRCPRSQGVLVKIIAAFYVNIPSLEFNPEFMGCTNGNI